MSIVQSQPVQTAKADVPAKRIEVQDDSEFQVYLDTGKFAMVQRAAVLFSESNMVPKHYRGSAASCFVAMSIAMRLKMDAYFFMQKTYPVGDKIGMEAQFAISLINTSGRFQHSLRYQLSGSGESRQCFAWTTDRDGTRLEGPTVSVQTAKDEGWYGRNPKWKSLTDLMLMYRSGSFFGRLYCPERLMGMQTDDELNDLPQIAGPFPQKATALESRLDAPAESSAAPPPPADPPAPEADDVEDVIKLDGAAFQEACVAALTCDGSDHGAMVSGPAIAATASWFKSLRGVKKWDDVAPQARREFYRACKSGRVTEAGTITD